jgi:acrylyl-CoA reductase (NADPH)
MPMRAIVIDAVEGRKAASLREFDEAELMDGDTLVRVTHSSLNYKDGLAITDSAPVVRRTPMIPGIDLAGIVETTTDPSLSVGDEVILNGWGTGETHLGAFAPKSKVPARWLIPKPKGFSAAEAMAIGTAGYTAALCVLALEAAGLGPEAGEVLVTGAAGGVGSVAVALLNAAGWSVIAATGRSEEADYLKALGARQIIPRADLSGPVKPLGKERWAAAIDVVGSTTLANVLAMTKYGGAVAACGLAGGLDLPTTVAPFILRDVSLLGVDSVMAPRERRLEAWRRLEKDLDLDLLARMTTTIKLPEVIAAASDIVLGRIRGRVVVDVLG